MTPATPFGSRKAVIEFQLTQEKDSPATPPAGGEAPAAAARFLLRGEEQAIMVYTDFVAPQVALGTVAPVAPASRGCPRPLERGETSRGHARTETA